MQVDELLRYIGWADTQIKKRGLQGAYAQLVQVLATNIAPNQPRQSFQSQREELQRLLRAVDFRLLNDTQIGFGSTIGLGRVVGEAGASAIDSVLTKHAADPVAIHSEISKLSQGLTDGMQKVGTIQAALNGLFEVPEDDYTEALVRVHFQGDVSIKDVGDLKTWTKNWYVISNGLAEATGTAVKDIKVTGASQGSIIYHLAAALPVALLLNKLLDILVQSVDRYFDLMIKAEGLRKAKLENGDEELVQMATKLELKAKEGLVKFQERTLAELTKEFKLDGHRQAALGKAIHFLQLFKVGGGEVDTVVRQDGLTEDQQAQAEIVQGLVAKVREATVDARRLNGVYLALLGEGKTGDDDEA